MSHFQTPEESGFMRLVDAAKAVNESPAYIRCLCKLDAIKHIPTDREDRTIIDMNSLAAYMHEHPRKKKATSPLQRDHGREGIRFSHPAAFNEIDFPENNSDA